MTTSLNTGDVRLNPFIRTLAPRDAHCPAIPPNVEAMLPVTAPTRIFPPPCHEFTLPANAPPAAIQTGPKQALAPWAAPAKKAAVPLPTVPAVGVAVEALCGEGVLHLRVGGEEAAQDGVVEAGVHVDDAEAVVVLMPSEAAAKGEAGAVLPLRPVGGGHAVAPWVEVAALHDIPIAVHNSHPASEQVGLHIVETVGIGGGVMYM